MDVLLERGPGRDFVAEEHTVRHMRGEFFVPRLANRQKRGAYQPSEDALSRARRFVAQVRGEAPGGALNPGVRQAVLDAFPEIRLTTPASCETSS